MPPNYQSIARNNHKLKECQSFKRNGVSFSFLSGPENRFGYRVDVRRANGMRKI